MKVIHFSETDLGGGAGISSYRLHRALVAHGVDSHFLVSRKFSADPTVREAFPARLTLLRRRVRERLDRLPLAFYPRHQETDFSNAWLDWGASRVAACEKADVVHLHWTNLGFLGVRELGRFAQPVLWSLKDMWPFTGGCHYSGDCVRFTQACGQCPILGSSQDHDLSRRQFLRKQATYRPHNFDYACLSQEALEMAGKSALLQGKSGHFLPIGVDLTRFQPTEPAVARKILGLPPTGFLVAFSALQLNDRRKGADLLAAASGLLASEIPPEQLSFVTFGGGSVRFERYPVHHLGLLRDETTMALALAAADVTVVPSREDTGPSLTIESLACGTPVVGFPIGANRDLIESGRNGFIARAFSAESLAEGLLWAQTHKHDTAVRTAARESVKARHDSAQQAKQYIDLYHRMLGARPR